MHWLMLRYTDVIKAHWALHVSVGKMLESRLIPPIAAVLVLGLSIEACHRSLHLVL